jgi:hypothetical protein
MTENYSFLKLFIVKKKIHYWNNNELKLWDVKGGTLNLHTILVKRGTLGWSRTEIN